jgi:HSP20 family protein
MNNLTNRSSRLALEAFPPLSLFEDTFNRLFSNEGVAQRPWSPAVDIAETDNDLVLTADIPGVRMEDIHIEIEDGTLTLSGSREFQAEDGKGGYHRIERSYGKFQRAFSLPDSVDAEKVSAAYKEGVLRVVLPKKEIAKPRTIKVQPVTGD